jgi:antitoxin PrlF
MVVTVTDKGQLTVPKAVREKLDIRPGTKVDFEVMPDGSVRMKVLTRGAAKLLGLLQRPRRKPHTVEEMGAGVGAAVADRAKRSKA